MFDSTVSSPKLVFLHIPKTAGQTVHNELSRAIGASDVSPVRVHTQVPTDISQFPEGYRLYSGHIDWVDLARVPDPKFVFSIVRDPRERIASFYFYLLKEAKALSAEAIQRPEHAGKYAVLHQSADDYFFGGNAAWRGFIQDHYDNFYCRYFASRKIRAGHAFSELPDRRKLRMALRNLKDIDWVYSVENLGALETDLKTLFGFDVSLTERFDNAGDRPATEKRWPRLLEQFETDTSRDQIEAFVHLDERLLSRLEL